MNESRKVLLCNLRLVRQLRDKIARTNDCEKMKELLKSYPGVNFVKVNFVKTDPSHWAAIVYFKDGLSVLETSDYPWPALLRVNEKAYRKSVDDFRSLYDSPCK